MMHLPSKWQFSIAFYDPKRKNILDFGSSRECGCNHNKSSIHAGLNAINYCRKDEKRNNYIIYIWRYTKDGDLKSAHCCHSCTKLIHKYGFQNRVYTFNDDNIVNAIIDNPQVSLGYKIKNDL